jgi:hypothetical protein
MKPTRKLLSAAATTAILYGLSHVTEVDKDLEQLVNVVVPILVAYFVPNEQETPKGDGVPA